MKNLRELKKLEQRSGLSICSGLSLRSVCEIRLRFISGLTTLVIGLLAIQWNCFGQEKVETTRQEETSSKSSIELIADPHFVQGFPVVFKVRVHGPQKAPKFDIQDRFVPVTFVWKSATGDDVYRVTSGRPSSGTVEIPGIGRVSGDWFRRNYGDADIAEVPKGQERAMIIDASSLAVGRRPEVDEIPPGQYKVTLKFNDFDVESTPLDVEIVAPTDAEKTFLETVSTYSREKLGDSKNWTILLASNVNFARFGQGQLSAVAKRQLQFHLLLSHVLSYEGSLETIDLDPLKKMDVPAHLEAEKAALLWEIQMRAKSKNVQTQEDELVKRYPGLQWRMERLRSGGKVFLTSKKKTGE